MGIDGEVWIDGSFVTAKIDPDDADLAIRLRGPEFDAATDEVADALDWATSDLKASHRIDGYAWAEWPERHDSQLFGADRREYWLRWFGTSRGGHRKGIVVIRLGAGMP